METTSSIFVAGTSGLVGSAVLRKLKIMGYENILAPTRQELDLTDQSAVNNFFSTHKPEFVFMAAGKVGGIYANNTYRADFFYENMTMSANVIHQSYIHETKRLIYFACNSMYPKHCPQPMREEHLLSDYLEPTSEAFAMSKLASLKMCEAYNAQYGTDFIPLIPTNVYGVNGSYEPLNSLVIPSLLSRFHQAKCEGAENITIWGSGEAKRDFLYADDLADAAIFLINKFQGSKEFNIGTGKEVSIKELAEAIKTLTGFDGEVVYDGDQLAGVDRKLQDLTRIQNEGWEAKTDLETGLALTYQDYVENHTILGRRG